MVKGITPNGIEFELDESKLDDYELLEALADLNDGDGLAIVKIDRLLLGKELTTRIKENIKAKDGKVSVSAFTAELTAILTAMGETGKK